MNEDRAQPTQRCPHCGTIAEIEPARGLRYRCLVCGGPRVPVDLPDVAPAPRATRALEQAQRLRFRLAAWRAGAAVVGAFGVLSLAVAALALALTSPGLVPFLLTALIVAVPLGIAAHGWRRSRDVRRELDAHLDEAWRFTLHEVLRARHSGGQEALDAAGVAHALRVDEARAEQLLADLEVNDLALSEVRADGVIKYSTLAPPRPRVAVGDLGVDTTEDAGASARGLDEDPEVERRGQRA